MRLSAFRTLSFIAVLGASSWVAADKRPPVDKTIAAHLNIFDELDFVVYSNQKWERLAESHATVTRRLPTTLEAAGTDEKV